ncbi:MAG: hypothetical protein HGB08_00360 [Candidatus Moranbacteria bacterium]|nr:hypothetical protein [Candidatus Moranbacteria bacterium]
MAKTQHSRNSKHLDNKKPNDTSEAIEKYSSNEELVNFSSDNLKPKTRRRFVISLEGGITQLEFSDFIIKTFDNFAKKHKIEEEGLEVYFRKDASKKKSDNNIGFYFYGSVNPVIDLGPKRQPLSVAISSMEEENEQLLHFLFDKSKD